jgi:hypothetical protein
MSFRNHTALAAGRWAAGILLGGVLLCSLACGGAGSASRITPRPIPPGILSISAFPRFEPPPTEQDFLNAFDLAYNAGVRAQFFSYTWKQLEPQAGPPYNLQDLTNAINFAVGRGFKQILIGIQVLNTVPREVPPDLETVGFDTPVMKQRFHALLDAIRPSLNRPEVKYISIGNEVDGYLGAHPDEWLTYKAFYEDALAYIHQIMPGIKVGVTVMFGGAVGPDAANVASLTSASDVYILTYYPLGDAFKPYGAQAPTTDFPRMVGLAGTRPVILQEVGYPSATLLDSSESEQAQFVTNVFQSWQAQGSKIPFLNYFMLHDFTQQMCHDFAIYYGFPDPNFEAYLCTLGLRRVDGVPKISWQAFVNGAASVGLPE